MAIKATFIADFASFEKAVKQAELDISKLGFATDKAAEKLNRMVDNFTGKKVVQDATLMAEAVERIGGVGKLTQKELERVGATATEAAAKLRAMGKDVPPAIQAIADQTKHLNTSQTAMIGTLKNLAGAFGIAFSVQQVTGFIGKVFTAAEAIQDTADKLGISTDAAQEFAYAIRQSGGEIDGIERALFEMNKQLGAGDKSTIAALKAIGLEFEEVRRLSPEDAFRAMAAGLKGITDPMLQAKLGTELFGKAWKDMSPVVNQGLLEVAKGINKMSADTIKALADAKQAWENFGNAVIVQSGNMLSALGNLPDTFRSITSSGREFLAFLSMWKSQGLGVAMGMAGVVAEAKKADIALPPMNRTIGRTTEQMKAAEEAAHKLAEEQKKSVEAMREFKNFLGIREMEDYAAAQKAAAEQIAENVRLELAMNIMYQKNAKAIGTYAENVALWSTGWQGYMQLAPGIVQNITNSGKALIAMEGPLDAVERLLQGITNDFAEMMVVGIRAIKEIDKILRNSELSKGDKFSAIAATGLSAAASIAGNNRAGQTLGGAASGAAVGSLFGPIGAGVGAALGGIVGFFKGRAVQRQLNEMKQSLIDQMGGWEGINKAAQKAGITLDKVLNAKNVKDYERAVAELNRRLDLQKTAWDKTQAAIEKYQFTLEELGPALQKQKLTETALSLFEEFKLLTGAGIDVDTVLRKMAGNINAFTQLAVEMGFEVDLAMKPIIQKMIEMGLLTDKNGNLITDLESSGINFSESMTEAFKEVADELREMVDLLRIFLGLTKEIPNTLPGAPPLPPGASAGAPNQPDVNLPSFATGTGGKYLDFGRGTLAMLHGKERVMTEGEMAGGIVVNVYGSVTTEQDLAETIARRLDQQLQMRHRLRAA